MTLASAFFLYWKRTKSKKQNVAVKPQQQKLSSTEMLSCRRNVATKLKCDIKLVGSATSRRRNSNYFLSLLFLWMFCCHLSSVLPVTIFLLLYFFFSFFIIIQNGQIFGVFHFHDHGSHRIRLLSLQVVHTTRKQAFTGMAGLKNWLYVGHQPLIVSFSRFVAFFSSRPHLLLSLLKSSPTHPLLFTEALIYRKGNRLSKGRLGKASVSDKQQESGNFLICKHLTQSFLFIIHLQNIFIFSVSPGTLCMCVCGT